jgi:hypothetical protein
VTLVAPLHRFEEGSLGGRHDGLGVLQGLFGDARPQGMRNLSSAVEGSR